MFPMRILGRPYILGIIEDFSQELSLSLLGTGVGRIFCFVVIYKYLVGSDLIGL